jgi:hypothetical protein
MLAEWQSLLAAYHNCKDPWELASIVKRLADLKAKLGIR